MDLSALARRVTITKMNYSWPELVAAGCNTAPESVQLHHNDVVYAVAASCRCPGASISFSKRLSARRLTTGQSLNPIADGR